MKKISLVVISLIWSITTLFAQSHDIESDNLYYSILSEENLTLELVGSSGTESEIVIPAHVVYNDKAYSVIQIGESAFDYNMTITSVTFPRTLKTIGDDAFWGCIGLTSLIIPESVTKIGEGAFIRCTGLESIVLSDGIEKIDWCVFYGCISLKNITWPSSLKKIDRQAFEGCLSLENIDLPESLESIGFQSFLSCSSLKSLKIPAGVTSVANWAFGRCSALQTVELPGSLAELGKYAFAECNALEDISFPEGFRVIGESAFRECAVLKTVRIPASVEQVGAHAFAQCPLIENISVDAGNPYFAEREGFVMTKDYSELVVYPNAKGEMCEIPVGTQIIRSGSFGGCTITTLTVPESLTEIREGALSDCKELEEVHFLANTAPMVEMDAFYGVNTECILYCPVGTKELYAASEELAKFAIEEEEREDPNAIAITPLDADREVITVNYYTLSGTMVSHPAEGGFLIRKTIFKDGRSKSEKIYRKNENR